MKWYDYAILCLLLILALVAPTLLSQTAKNENWVFGEATAHVGDTIGGITAPFIGLAVGYLTYLAFREQRSANKDNKEQFDVESRRNKINEFINFKNKEFDKIKITNTNIIGYEAVHYFFEYISIVRLLLIKSFNPSIDDDSVYEFNLELEFKNKYGYNYNPRNLILQILILKSVHSPLKPLLNVQASLVNILNQLGSNAMAGQDIVYLNNLCAGISLLGDSFVITALQSCSDAEIIKNLLGQSQLLYFDEYCLIPSKLELFINNKFIKDEDLLLIVNNFSDTECALLVIWYMSKNTHIHHTTLLVKLLERGISVQLIPVEYCYLAKAKLIENGFNEIDFATRTT